MKIKIEDFETEVYEWEDHNEIELVLTIRFKANKEKYHKFTGLLMKSDDIKYLNFKIDGFSRLMRN